MSWTICWEAGYPDTCHRVRFSETERLIVGNAFRDSNSLHGANDEEWKGWKAIEPASHPFPFLLEIPRDFHIPTVSTKGSIFRNSCKSRQIGC